MLCDVIHACILYVQTTFISSMVTYNVYMYTYIMQSMIWGEPELMAATLHMWYDWMFTTHSVYALVHKEDGGIWTMKHWGGNLLSLIYLCSCVSAARLWPKILCEIMVYCGVIQMKPFFFTNSTFVDTEWTIGLQTVQLSQFGRDSPDMEATVMNPADGHKI